MRFKHADAIIKINFDRLHGAATRKSTAVKHGVDVLAVHGLKVNGTANGNPNHCDGSRRRQYFVLSLVFDDLAVEEHAEVQIATARAIRLLLSARATFAAPHSLDNGTLWIFASNKKK